MTRTRVALGGACVLWLLAAGAVQAQPDARETVPPGLEPWVPWVLAKAPQRDCPVIDGETACVWIGQLELQLANGGGPFVQRVVTDAPAWIALPGDPGRWPLDVRVDGSEVPVLQREGRPAVRLDRGSHRIEGRLAFDRLPEVLAVPPSTALVDLELDGEPVPHPRREEDGTLWLRRRAGGDEGEARLDVQVARRVVDGVPVRVVTRLRLEVGGRPREVNLGDVLVPGTVPLGVTAEVPSRIDAEGDLLVQVVAGTHTVEVEARTEGPAGTLRAPEHAEPWPDHEVWVWDGDQELRQVDLRGPPAIDPSRTHLEGPWAELPAYVVRPGAELEVVTLRRGEPQPPPNDVHLKRSLWMDLDGTGYTVRDRLEGTLHRAWRLNLLASDALGHAEVGGRDRLITLDPDGGHPGVELREADLDMTSEWRLPEARARVPAVGWSTDVQSLSWDLHLPPGWSVLAVAGADEANGTWLGSWDLFDFFFVLIVALALARLFGWSWGVLALIMLALCHGQDGAPYAVWASLVAVVALLRVLPVHWTRWVVRAGWWGTVIVLAIVTVPFAVEQVQQAIHPQARDRGRGGLGFDLAAPTPMAEQEPADGEAAPTSPPADGEKAVVEDGAIAESMEEADVSRTRRARPSYADEASEKKLPRLEQDPNAVIQTGPGVPEWRWRTWRMRWSGPVERDHEVRLWLLSPPLQIGLTILRVALVLLLAVVFVGRSWPRTRPKGGGAPAPTAAAGALLLVAALGGAAPARAQPDPPAPDPAILAELERRLTAPAPCRPDCVSASSGELSLQDDQLTVILEAHAGAPSSLRLPGPVSDWTPREVRLDGEPTAALALRDDGYIHVRLGEGTHRIEARGEVPGDALTLQLPDPVHRFTVGPAPGWDVDGLGEDGRATTSLRLTRVGGIEGEGDDPEGGAALPPWLRIRRTLHAGVGWRMHTVVERVSPPGSPIVARVPLVEGESVQRSDLTVEDGQVVVPLGDQDTQLAWWSSLEPRDELVLRAPEGVPWTEAWQLVCGSVWHCEPGTGDGEGPPPVAHVEEGRWQPRFRPWPGESVTWRFRRPAAAEGSSVTIDSATLEVSPGVRLERAELSLRVRSSSGGVRTVTLPEGARVQSVAVDGSSRPFRQRARELDVSLSPGVQMVTVEWQQGEGMGFAHEAPRVEVGGAAANARVAMRVPPERWLLAVSGPPWGPAVLFWSYLLVVLLFAWILSRIPGTPLRGWQWALLGFGLTQVHPAAALTVVAWFFVLRWRRDRAPARPLVFDLVQILLLIATLVVIGILFTAVQRGLLVQPDMQVAGAGSSQTELRWYVDRVDGALPTPSVWSLPLWAWKVVMLLWSLWLAWSLVRWLPWAWRSFSAGGWWKRLPRPPRPAPAPGGTAAEPPPGGTEGSGHGGGAPPGEDEGRN